MRWLFHQQRDAVTLHLQSAPVFYLVKETVMYRGREPAVFFGKEIATPAEYPEPRGCTYHHWNN